MDYRPRYAAFARLFEYPGADYLEVVRALQLELETSCPEAAPDLARFSANLAPRRFAEIEELYFRTFDLAAQCAPYVSVHLFGEESFKRAELMTALAEAYAGAGLARGTELPDHLAVVLKQASTLPEWQELSSECLLRAVAGMGDESEKAQNPYQHVFAALFTLLFSELGLTRQQAQRHVAKQSTPLRRADGHVSPGPVLGLEVTCGSPGRFAEERERG